MILRDWFFKYCCTIEGTQQHCGNTYAIWVSKIKKLDFQPLCKVKFIKISTLAYIQEYELTCLEWIWENSTPLVSIAGNIKVTQPLLNNIRMCTLIVVLFADTLHTYLPDHCILACLAIFIRLFIPYAGNTHVTFNMLRGLCTSMACTWAFPCMYHS